MDDPVSYIVHTELSKITDSAQRSIVATILSQMLFGCMMKAGASKDLCDAKKAAQLEVLTSMMMPIEQYRHISQPKISKPVKFTTPDQLKSV
jgi:hypothetical protein